MSAPRAQHDEVWANWNRWFDRARQDVERVHLDRTLFTALRAAIIQRGPPDTSLWLEHYALCYRDRQVMAVRRIMDKASIAESFGRLLHAMETSPQVFTLERVLDSLEYHEDWRVGEVSAAWRAVGLPGSNCVNPDWVRGIREKLETETEAVVAYSHRMVAHPDQRGQELPLTWGELNAVADDLASRIQEFALKFRAVHYELNPIITGGDWRDTFRRPLFEPHPAVWPPGYPDY